MLLNFCLLLMKHCGQFQKIKQQIMNEDLQHINHEYLRIVVTDTGDGLTEKDIDKLFVPFERLNDNEGIEGTGIGLVITKQLVELMNGRIGVDSTTGKGSSFWVEVKIVQEAHV